MADVTYREALRQALDEELERDPDVFLMGEEIGRFEGSYKVTAGLWEKYGGVRVRETPISEEGFVGAGIGAAMMGLRPVIEIMTINFILVAMDQVINHAAKIRYMFGGKVGVPLVIRTPGGAGAQLTAQHSQSLEAWFAGCPGLKVVAPATPADAYGMLKTAIRDDDPVLFCENLVLYNLTGPLPENGDGAIPLGRAQIAREGDDLTLVAHSYTVQRALRVADRLAQDGIGVEVVDLRSLRPLDVDTVAESVRKTNRVLVAEEGWSTYGVGAELAARLQRVCFDDLDAPVERVGQAEGPMPYSTPLELAALDGEGVLDRLETAGLVRRIRDTQDRRRVIVEVTDEVDRRGAPVYGPLVADATQAHAVFDADQLELITRFIRIERELLSKHTARVAAMSGPAMPLTAKRASGSGEA